MSDTMNLNEGILVRKYFWVFFILGQCSLSSSDDMNNRNRAKNYWYSCHNLFRNLAIRVPAMLFFTLNIIFAVFATINQPTFSGKFSDTNSTVGFIFIGCAFVTNCMISIQHLRHINIMNEFSSMINSVCAKFNERLHAPLCLNEFRREFLIKIGLLIGSYVQLIIMFGIGMLVLQKFMLCPYSYMLTVLTDISCLFAIFCIDLVNKVLIEINCALVNERNQLEQQSLCVDYENRAPKLLENIETLKQIYLMAFSMSRKINDYFGWFFLCYLIQHFFDLASDFFWLFLINHDDFNYKLICKLTKWI